MKNKCKVGQQVIHVGTRTYGSMTINDGELAQVDHIVCQGIEDGQDKKGRVKKGCKADITICRIMGNGQVLSRSPVNIGENWRHLPED